MKVGDNLLCKVSIDFDFPWYNTTFTKGKYYEITSIDEKVVIKGISFLLTTYNQPENWLQPLWKYFYTTEEMRKFKLEKINDRQE